MGLPNQRGIAAVTGDRPGGDDDAQRVWRQAGAAAAHASAGTAQAERHSGPCRLLIVVLQQPTQPPLAPRFGKLAVRNSDRQRRFVTAGAHKRSKRHRCLGHARRKTKSARRADRASGWP